MKIAILKPDAEKSHCSAFSFISILWREYRNRSMWLLVQGTLSFFFLCADLMTIRDLWKKKRLKETQSPENAKITMRPRKRTVIPTCIWRALCSQNYHVWKVISMFVMSQWNTAYAIPLRLIITHGFWFPHINTNHMSHLWYCFI